MGYPTDRMYTKDHEWITTGSDAAKVGITQFAATALDEAVFVDLPEVGTFIEAEEPCGEIESVKSVSDLVAPASGTVKEINEAVVDDPSLATSTPHESWLYSIDVSELGTLMSAEEYEVFIAEEA